MNIELDKKGWVGHLLKLTYGKYFDLPRNLCLVFWLYVLSLALLPFTFISFFYKAEDFVDRFMSSVVAWLGLTLIYLLGCLIYTDPVGLLIIISIIVGVTMAIAVIGFACFAVYMEVKDIVEDSTIIRESWKGFKEGYCPRVTWKD